MSDFVNIWKNLDWTVPVQIVMNILPSLLCITLHELSHGFVAYRLGDTTAKDAGRLTLNPIKHIDIMGLLMMIVFRFGWAKPVPVNMYRFKNPKKSRRWQVRRATSFWRGCSYSCMDFYIFRSPSAAELSPRPFFSSYTPRRI